MKSFLLCIVLLLSFICHAQRVGIGTTSPVAKLDIVGEGSSSATSNLVLKNSLGDTMLRMRNDGRLTIRYNGENVGRTLNVGGNGMNFYVNDVDFGGAIFPTDTSLVIWSATSDNKYVILQPSWGKVGIGTFAPQATLDVKGSVVLGKDGTVINNLIKIILLKDPAPVPANSSTIETFAVPGAALGSVVSISPAVALPDGLLISYARVSATDIVEVKFTNVTGAAINPSLMVFFIAVID